MNTMKPWILAAAVAAFALSFVAVALAQAPSPPSAFRGTVTSPDGPVETGLSVAAYVGETDCTNNAVDTFSNSPGVTEYYVVVQNASTRDGCNGDIRFEIGGRAATQTGSHGGGGLTTLNLTLAPEAPESVNVDVTVWRSVRTGSIFVSTRPEGASWTTHNTPVDLSALSGSGSFYQGSPIPITVNLGGGTTVNIDVTVWRSVRTDSIFVSTRPQGASWTTHNTPVDLSQLSSSGSFYQGSPISVEVDLRR